MAIKQPKWDIYEAVVLLDGYLEMRQLKQPRKLIIGQVSSDLRRMAVNRGYDIDDVFRNENGISYQIQSMDSAYRGEKVYVPATKLFEMAVEMYRTDSKRYLEILDEAKRMIADKQDNKTSSESWTASDLPSQSCMWIESNDLPSAEQQASPVNENVFYQYLLNTAKLSERTCAAYVSSIRSAERYASGNGYMSCSLINTSREMIIETAKALYSDPDFIRYNDDQHHRFTAAINKMMEFLGADIPRKALPSISSNNVEQASASAEIKTNIVNVLKQHYQYGFKYDSIRELMRFRQFADGMGIVLPDDDGRLKALISSFGTLFDGKVYYKNDDIMQGLREIVDGVFSSGASVIYYECLFEHESHWMNTHAITSPDMLKAYLQNYTEGYSFSKKFMVKGSRRTERESVTDELKRVWGFRPIERVDSLNDRLPYIPYVNIWRVISGNNLFVLVSEGEYLFTDYFRVSEDEEEDILDYVEEACEKNSFASLSDVPLGNIEEENYELSQPAIYSAIYKKVLSDKYHLSGRILTKEKIEMDILTLLKQYIAAKEECTFNEVTGKAIELTGNKNRRYVFQALYECMVRVNKDRFVTSRQVSFPVDEIDSVLSELITDHFLAIRDVSTFAMFPICGQIWNLYLLESFCFKYSKKYSLRVIHFNDKNAGIIAERDFNKAYDEMLSIALARIDVELSPEVSGLYLFNAGYLAKSKYTKLNEIMQRASELRKAK